MLISRGASAPPVSLRAPLEGAQIHPTSNKNPGVTFLCSNNQIHQGVEPEARYRNLDN